MHVVQVLTRIRGFAAMNRLKKEALKVIAGNLPMDEIVGLKEMFHAMDKDSRSGHAQQLQVSAYSAHPLVRLMTVCCYAKSCSFAMIQ